MYHARAVGRRLGRLATALFVILTATFLLVHLIPGDPVRAALGPGATQEFVNERRHLLRLDEPLLNQYWNYWRQTFTGNFGTSVVTNLPVGGMITSRLRYTAELVCTALPLALLTALVFGVWIAAITAGRRRAGALQSFQITTSALTVIPEYIYGVGLILVTAIWLDWLPGGGAEGWRTLILPAITMAIGSAAALARIVRAQTQDVLATEYIRLARSKRLPTRVLYLRHAMPNLLNGALTLGGVLVGTMIAGSVIVETVFARPGIGSLLVQSIAAKDYPVVQACLLLLATVVLGVNALIDITLGWLDPRSLIGRN